MTSDTNRRNSVKKFEVAVQFGKHGDLNDRDTAYAISQIAGTECFGRYSSPEAQLSPSRIADRTNLLRESVCNPFYQS
jgi:hypothetical protein